MALKGLIIREPWIDEILAGRKTWELRSKPFRHRGEIALIRKGSGLVVGMANMIDCLSPLGEKRLRETAHLHRVPPDMIEDVFEKGWIYPWVLSDVRRLASPVRYRHKSGAVITVDLDDETERAVRRQLQSSQPPESPRSSGWLMTCEHPAPKPLALGTMSGSLRAQAMATLPHIGGKSVRSITDADVPARISTGEVRAACPNPPRDLPASVLRKRRTFRRKLQNVRLTVEAIAALTASICLLVWIGRLVLVGILDTIFTWEGIRWFIWSMLGAVVMGAAGDRKENPAMDDGTV